ncbi:type I polyketide synthase [Krasilnikovia sp. MM14-A1004]|uniref:type I polyketide synthase n=1 Tax=Krasilnikovia sp. MM14-A1004 TaxID=3373541 RepID=UPI00399D1A25
MPDETSIAVTGMACRYPGAPTLHDFWTALRSGVDGITRYDRDDLVARGHDPDLVRRPDFVPAEGVVAGSRNFDWTFFGYSRAEAATIDPQQRIFLECAARAIDDAGLDPTRFPGLIGVYAGAEEPVPTAGRDVDPLLRLIGRRPDFLTTRVAYKLGLRGPAVTVQTACSTSLTAVHMAVQSLLAYECDAALAGGVSLAGDGVRGYLYQEGGILSPDGYCRPFDERAAGTVPGEGVGVVVLRRLADALRDGDRIVAVIRGSAINNDGSDKIGFTAPSVAGQRDAIVFAQKVAEVDPADIHHVETHGTGTRIGDPIEFQALTDAFHADADADADTAPPCWLGAVKSNIGHTGSAAGVAALIKTALMLEHRELVPTLHFTAPNPLLKIEATSFQVCTRRQPWPDRGVPLAAVSSFGVGGTNAHVIVEAAPRPAHRPVRQGLSLLAFSAPSPGRLHTLREDLATHLGDRPDLSLPAVSRTLAGRRQFGHRYAVAARTPAEAAERLSAVAPAVRDAVATDRVGFLFPGQGTLRHAAGAAAYRLLPGFAGHFDTIADSARRWHGVDLGPVVHRGRAGAEWFADTVHQQLGLLALGYALGRQLHDWRLRPAALLGNSIGEYAAALIAEVWTPQDATRLVYERATAMRDTRPGRMVTVSAEAEELSGRIGDEIEIAVAGSGWTVLSGPAAAMDELLAGPALTGWETRPLATNRAFHSAAMEPAAEALRAAVRATPGRLPRVRMVSNASGGWAAGQDVPAAEYWARQLRRTVRLGAGAATLLGAGCDTFVELGPGTSMLGALRRHPDWNADAVTVTLLGRDTDDDERALLDGLGALWERGIDVPVGELPGAPIRCSLPPNPLESADPARAPEQAAVTGTGTVPRPAGDRRAVLEGLWCAALGVSTAADSDDFFALGGESLMVVSLIGKVRERLGGDLSVAEFSRRPTFGALIELTAQGSGNQVITPPGLVPLRAGDGGRPVFLAADALGSTASYRVLAGLVDTDRALYGLDQGPASGRRERPSIARIAARHLDAIRQVDDRGPYTIGGWSFGAVVAHEMAAQLVAAGHEVEMLLAIDGFPPRTRGLPVGAHPGYLVSNLRLALNARLGRGPAGGAAAPGSRFGANIGALLAYRPGPVPCPATAFPATGAAARDEVAARVRRRLSGLYSRVDVRPVAGDHWSMLAGDAQDLAVQLSAVLAQPADHAPKGARR